MKIYLSHIVFNYAIPGFRCLIPLSFTLKYLLQLIQIFFFCTTVFHSIRYYKNCYSFFFSVSVIHLLQFFVYVQNLWGEAVLMVNFILNRVPYRKTQQTPYEKWKGRMPNLNYLKVWGCLTKVAVPKPKKVKVGPKTVDCVFIGYA